MPELGLVTGHGFTRGIGVTGDTGAGAVWDITTPRHTATHTRGVAGFHRYVHLFGVLHCPYNFHQFFSFLFEFERCVTSVTRLEDWHATTKSK